MAKVADFGTARSLAPTIAGRTVDNPIWLAPEVMRNEEYTEKVPSLHRVVHFEEVLTAANVSGGRVLVRYHPVRDLLAQVPVRQEDPLPDRARGRRRQAAGPPRRLPAVLHVRDPICCVCVCVWRVCRVPCILKLVNDNAHTGT
jgi:hypothetical protein